ncbi:hypothetical protein FY133_00570 [Agrobacterium tumefaciens]|uniref:hypothetical protein n=1 Tax=Agrobacterium tumefaciens TaxID=358 RepID=UPI0021CF026F|nr:hypothetical protein [Agrobacterium tumefaciens]UXT64145.1 hypothetical protein FY133_00570 [Agrobacterium tumefaciens]
MVLKSGTLLIPSGPSHDPDRKHLFVVCTDACDEEKQLIVPVSGYSNNLCDGTCILEIGEHEFITKRSYAFYRNARIESAATLDNGLNQKVFVPKADVDPAVFKRIIDGICTSPQTARRIKKYAGC